jgi:hypothetical protein
MEQFIKANGHKVNFMEMVYMHGLMDLLMMEVISMVLSMDLENIFIHQKKYTKENG